MQFLHLFIEHKQRIDGMTDVRPFFHAFSKQTGHDHFWFSNELQISFQHFENVLGRDVFAAIQKWKNEKKNFGAWPHFINKLYQSSLYIFFAKSFQRRQPFMGAWIRLSHKIVQLFQQSYVFVECLSIQFETLYHFFTSIEHFCIFIGVQEIDIAENITNCIESDLIVGIQAMFFFSNEIEQSAREMW